MQTNLKTLRELYNEGLVTESLLSLTWFPRSKKLKLVLIEGDFQTNCTQQQFMNLLTRGHSD